MKKIKALAVAGVFTAALSATAFAEMADVKVGGEIRVRDVITNNSTDFNKDNDDRTSVVEQRTRVNVDAKIDETTKAFISLQDSRNWGDETNAAGTALDTASTGNDTQAVDVSQAYLQLDKLFGQPLSLKIGRQALAYGDERLVGAYEWGAGRRFDALKLVYNTDAFSVDLWTAKVGENTADTNDAYLNGLYATVKSIPTSTLDLYLLEKKNTSDGVDILTYGARINGGAMNIDWTAEAAWQSGDASATSDQDANMYILKAGYTIPQAANLRIGAEYDFASGNDASSSDNEAFDNLYPTNHPLYGVTDIVNTLSNLSAWTVNVSAKPAKGLKLLAEYWDYSTDEEYTSGEDHVGNEFNIQAWYALSNNVDLHAYWARFSPDDKWSGTNDDPADNVTLQVAVKF